jgi:hypothetical protein
VPLLAGVAAVTLLLVVDHPRLDDGLDGTAFAPDVAGNPIMADGKPHRYPYVIAGR